MRAVMKKIILIVILLLLAAIVFIVIELLYIKLNGKNVAAPTIPRAAITYGTGRNINVVIIGDSTAIGQGTDYSNSYAVAVAQHLSKHYTVHLTNVGVSGARAADAVDGQLEAAAHSRPDIAVVAVGANDVTHFTSVHSYKNSLQTIISKLQTANPSIKIIVTGSPDMGSSARFPWPLKQLAGIRTRQLNAVVPTVVGNNVIWAKIAKDTGGAFRKDPSLFAQDKFHPNKRGYKLWTVVINQAVDKAVQTN
jgi:lysophospholipase L1-like esterase